MAKTKLKKDQTLMDLGDNSLVKVIEIYERDYACNVVLVRDINLDMIYEVSECDLEEI